MPLSPLSGGYPQQQAFTCEDPDYKIKQRQQQQSQQTTGHANNNGNTTGAETPQAQPQSSNAQGKKRTKAAPSAKSLSALKPDKEEKYVRVRDVKEVKTHNLPTDSANVQGGGQ